MISFRRCLAFRYRQFSLTNSLFCVLNEGLRIQSLGVAVSHVTGTVNKLGINLTSLEITVAIVGACLWASYVFGACLGQALHDRIGTAVPLLIEGISLTFIGLFAPDDIHLKPLSFWLLF